MKIKSKVIAIILTVCFFVSMIPMASAYATIYNGSQGSDVRTMQTMLNAVSNAGLTVDGICGPKSIAAVKAFQSANGLSADGICGPKTWAVLEGKYNALSVCSNHTKGTYLWPESAHPHYNYYTCAKCGASFTDGSTTAMNSCTTCNPVTSQVSAADIVSTAESLVGKYPYVWGGESPSEGGFDCTGLVYYVYNTCLGINMSLTQARSKSKLLAMGGQVYGKTSFHPGDIIQFTYSHVAIYVGADMVVEASSSKGEVRKRSIANDTDVDYAIRLPNIVQTAAPTVCQHNWARSYFEDQHPHYWHYKCALCGEEKTDGTTTISTACTTCNPQCTTHRFNSANGNNCTKCSYVYVPAFTIVNKTYQAAKDGVPVRTNYYANSSQIVRTLSKGTQVKVTSSFRNSVGNLWYKTSDGYYIFSDNLIEAQSTTAYGDSGVVTFSRKKDGGVYLTKNFKVSEFACNDGSDEIPIDMELVGWLQQIRDHFGAAVTINSGYRSPSHNKRIGGATNSYHLYGRAADIVVSGHKPREVAQYAASIGIRGIELNERYGYVHIDTRDAKYWFVPIWNSGKISGYQQVSGF